MSESAVIKAAPVYVPYSTLLSSLETLKIHGIPKSGILDKSIWDSQSGAVQAQLILAYRFLGFIDDQKNVMPILPPLVAASAEERKALLKPVIEDKYQSVISLGLLTISPAQFEEAFRKFDISGSTLDRATRFFVNACTQLGIPIGKRFVERAKPTGPRKRRAPVDRMAPPPPPPDPAAVPIKGTSKTIKLQSGGELTISATLDLFALNATDRKFVFGLIDSLEGYAQPTQEPVE